LVFADNMNPKKIKRKNRKEGIAALLVVVVVSAVVLTMAFGAAMTGIGELDMGFTVSKGMTAFAFADGCMEEALRRLRIDKSWPSALLSVDGGSCIMFNVDNADINPPNDRRTILVVGSDGTYFSFIEAVVDVLDIGNVVTIQTWKEI